MQLVLFLSTNQVQIKFYELIMGIYVGWCHNCSIGLKVFYVVVKTIMTEIINGLDTIVTIFTQIENAKLPNYSFERG